MKQYPGYTLVRTEPCPEQHGTLTLLTHDISGATVLLVENQDPNKAFGIGFGTFPSDDTGVFHILEHSVLSGSEKYPVKSPFLQLMKASMASFLNAMTFPDKTVYPFATPNEADFKNLMDIYLNAVFCPLAVTDPSVFEQEGWHREADGSVSGVVYNEMQGSLAAPDAQLIRALNRAVYPDNAYGFVSGGDPESIPALSYDRFCRVYRRYYSASNCCITLYGQMEMEDKLALLDSRYLSHMPRTTRPQLTLQTPQTGVRLTIPYSTEKPEPNQVQCALSWYTGSFADRERQLGVEILLDALMGNNNAPLQAALLAEGLGADIDMGFDDSTLQPTMELVLRGATQETAPRFAAAVRKAVDDLLAQPLPQDLLLASLNAAEFNSLERPGSLPDGVLDAINAVTGWLHAGDPTLLLHTNRLFDALREKLETGWFDQLLRELFAPAPVEVIQVPALPAAQEEKTPIRRDEKMTLDHPLTVADLGEGEKLAPAVCQQMAGAELLHRPSAGSLYLNFYYDLGQLTPEELTDLDLVTDLLDELDTSAHTAQQLNTLRSTWLGESRVSLSLWTGRQAGSPCHAKLTATFSLLERNLDKALELAAEWLYDTRLTGSTAQAAIQRVLSQQKLRMEQMFLQQGHSFAMTRAAAHYSVEAAAAERCSGVTAYHRLCSQLEQGDFAALGARLEAVRAKVLHGAALTISLHGSEDAFQKLCQKLPVSAFAEASRPAAQPYTEPLPQPVNEAFIIDGGVSYDVQSWPMERQASRRVLARVMSYEYLWHEIREVGGAYGTGMLADETAEALYTYRDPQMKQSYETFAKGPAALVQHSFTEADLTELIVGAAAKLDTPLKPCQEAKEADRRYFCGITDAMIAADRQALCQMNVETLHQQAAALEQEMAVGTRVAFGPREAVEAAKELFDRVEQL